MQNSHFYAFYIFEPLFYKLFNLFESTWKKICLDNSRGEKSFNLQKNEGLFYLHFLYIHESLKKIKGEPALPTDLAWLYPPPWIAASSQLGADCSLAAFKQASILLNYWRTTEELSSFIACIHFTPPFLIKFCNTTNVGSVKQQQMFDSNQNEHSSGF